MSNQVSNIKAPNKTSRNSSFELLRIISMLLIVAHHFVVHGEFDLTSSFSKNIFFLQCLSMFGKLGVNLFVLTSGYFLCKQLLPPPIKIFNKLIKLELEVIFYSSIIGIIFYNFFPSPDFDFRDLLKTFTPLRSNCYWFYRSYFVLYLISPFLNSFIKAIDKIEFRKLLLTIFVIWVILPFFPKIPAIEMSNLTWFIFIYLCAAYIRYYQEDFSRKISFIFTISIFLLIILSVLSFDLIGIWKKAFLRNYDYFLPMNSILIFILSISTLVFFSKIDIGNIKWINIISSATFGVYLIHDNKLMRNLLWVKIFKNSTYIQSNRLILYSILVILIVYILCTLIALIRIYILEKPILKFLNRNKNLPEL